LEAAAPLLFSFGPGGVASFVSLVFGSVWISITWSALLCILHRPRHRYQRRPTLSYHQRVLRLTSCVRSRPQRKSRGYRNKSKYKSILGSIRRRRSRRKRDPSLSIRHRLREKLGEDFLHQVSFKADSVSLSEFVLVIDPMEHLKKLQSCSGHHVGGKPLYQESVLFQVSHSGLFSINPTRPNEPVVSTNSQRDYNEDLSIVIDTGASWSVTPFLMDFVSSINESSLDSLYSLDGQIQVCGKGTVQWTVQDQMGVVRTLRHTGLYVPRASVRLFSLQTYCMEHNGDGMLCTPQGIVLTLNDHSTLCVPWHQQSNLTYLLTQKLYEQVHGRNSTLHQRMLCESTFQIPAGQAPLSCVLDDANLNLT
jgi:hypothetical protein